MDFRKSLKAHVSNLKKKEHITEEFLLETLNNIAGFCDYCPFCVSERPDFCNYEDEGCYIRKEKYGKR